jgi:hypothetical protein
MRFGLLTLLLLIFSVTAAFAHDDSWRLMNCYSGKHCHQDTLVFGVITELRDNTFKIKVSKTYRSKRGSLDSKIIRLRKGDFVHWIGRDARGNSIKEKTWWFPFVAASDPKVGDAVIVAFLRQGRHPQVTTMIRSQTADWQKATVDAKEHYGPIVEFEHYIRSGGVGGYYFINGRVYVMGNDHKLRFQRNSR